MDIKRINPLLVIFDLDGTLVDTETISFNTWKDVGKSYGLEVPDELIYSFIGRNSEAIKNRWIKEMGDIVPFDELYKIKKEIANEEYNRSAKLKDGVIEFLKVLDELGIKKAVATSSSKDRAERLLGLTGILDRFDLMITGDMVLRSKPNPEIFLKTMEEMDVNPLETIVIEDSKNGIKAAKRSGAITVLIPDILKPDEEMIEKSDFIFENMMQLKDFITSQYI